MQAFILGGLGGVLAVQNAAQLPALAPLAALFVVALVFWRCGRAPWAVLLAACLAGVAVGAAYTTLRAQWRLDARLDAAHDGQTRSLAGTVRGLPERVGDGLRFRFVPDEAGQGVPELLALAWYPARRGGEAVPVLAPGERWRLTVRLRSHSSLFNAGGFDYAGWQFARGVGGGGYVREGARLAEQDEGVSSRIDRVRARIRARIGDTVGGGTAGLLSAMAVGDQGGIDDGQWRTLRATGTAHLVAISGLHVSMVALLAGWLVGGLWRRAPALTLRLPAQRAAMAGAALAACGYAALAGFGVPVTRALLMVLVAAAALYSARRPPAARVLLLALAGVLAVDPWAVLSAGFWLSFGAVAALMLVLGGRLGTGGRLAGFARAQWAVTAFTAPFLLALFGQMSLASPLANALAIPVVSFAVVPLLLGGSMTGLDWPLRLAGGVMDVLMAALERIAAWPWAMWSHADAPLPLVVLAAVGVLVCLLPRGTPLRAAGALALVPMLMWSPPRPAPGAFDATVIDVGQGLAVHVRTSGHELLYDTGRAYYRGGDAGERIVVPYLRAVGVSRLDALVISHDDRDHAGGARSVLDALRVERVIGGAGVSVGPRELDRCRAGEGWEWDGVRFEWLHPAEPGVETEDNNRSCVLRVAGRGGSLLVPGDIEAHVEQKLVRERRLVPSTVVVAPHHGSASSSSAELIEALQARHVVFATGYRNPFGHPKPAVVARWRAAGARAWRSDLDGAIHIAADGTGLVVRAERPARLRYWHAERR